MVVRNDLEYEKALFLPVASKNTNGFVDRYLRPWSSKGMHGLN